jgi:hypothetical protein
MYCEFMLDEDTLEEDTLDVVWFWVVAYCPWAPNEHANMNKASKAGKNLDIFMVYTPTINWVMQ